MGSNKKWKKSTMIILEGEGFLWWFIMNMAFGLLENWVGFHWVEKEGKAFQVEETV